MNEMLVMGFFGGVCLAGLIILGLLIFRVRQARSEMRDDEE